MIVRGRAIAKDILASVHTEADTFEPIVVRAITVAPSAATLSYLAIKERRAGDAGMMLDVVQLPDDADEAAIIAVIQREGADAVIVQLPLPESIDTARVLDAIPETLDADVLSIEARTAYAADEAQALMPPVVAAIAEIFERAQVEVAGTRAVVIGNGWLVGAPAARFLRRMGATVDVLVKDDADYEKLAQADIVICGAGSPGLVRPEMLKQGVVLIDAGTSESEGEMVGDADPGCAERASVFTPVPGGVGPIAVACLFRNALILAKRHRLQTP
jgi:5,10-methylene-tetrahydrofolate dehydrogenase/methenyl tetrahydrofolate cyclohydrolase